MDFELTEEQKRFKEEVSAFLDKEVIRGVVEESEAGLGFGPYSWEFIRKLGVKRWVAPTFPVAYGGLGLSPIYRFIIQHELDYRRALQTLPGVGLIGANMAGPVILRHGSDELKREFLPRIAQGEIELALGYTEPDAGSDLSMISIRAVEDGDDFVITGQKTFNTSCHFAQYHWLAARTGSDVPSHKGISMFIVDLKTPGITLNPMWEISDTRTNEVFYDEVRVPKKYLVGEKDMGWDYMTEALNRERVFVIGTVERTFGQLVTYAKTTLKNGAPLCKDPYVRQKLVDLAIEMNVARNLIRYVVWLQDKDKVPGEETSILKLFVCDLYQKIARAGLEILGPYGQLRKNSKYAVLEGAMEHFFRGTYVMTIGAGTSEIMRNVIATRGLGLPR
jgi:alkylation response protein AidB-like acyl-CoA dehydrogenase